MKISNAYKASRPNYQTCENWSDYKNKLLIALESVSNEKITKVAEFLAKKIVEKKRIFTCGNGGSASISDHLHCDFAKGIAERANLKPRVYTLTANTSTLTAYSNDYSYNESFSLHLANQCDLGDVLIAISSSGNSANIINAVKVAESNGLNTIGLVGFDGGQLAKSCDYVLHVNSNNYGVIEDVHQMMMHAVSQEISKTFQGSSV